MIVVRYGRTVSPVNDIHVVGMKYIRKVWAKAREFLQQHRKTNVCECRHLKLTKYLLKFFGLWPHQSKFIKACNYLIFITWTITCTIPFVQGMREGMNGNFAISVKSLIASIWIWGTLAQGTMLFMRPQWLRKLYEQIESDWEGINNAVELAILRRLSRNGDSFSTIYIGSSAIGYSIFLILTYLPYYINMDVRRNITNIIPYSEHWIIFDGTRDIQTITHICLEVVYGSLMHITVMSMYMVSVKHTCGMYAIVSYRLRNLLPPSGKIIPSNQESDTIIIPQLLDIIEKHRAAIKNAHIVGRLFSRTFLATQISLLICLALSIFDMSFNINSIYSIIRIFCIFLIFVEHSFYINYGGQQIIESSNKVFMSTYFIDWYLLSTNSRKILLMIILRSSRTKQLCAGGMTLSLSNFTTIMKASWSLATALLSMQKNF